MIDLLEKGIADAVGLYAAGYWTGDSDGISTFPVYRDSEFDPTDATTYKHVLASTNYSAIVWGLEQVNDPDHPYSHLKLRTTGGVTIMRKSENYWSPTKRRVRPLTGSSVSDNDLPLMNSLWEFATGWACFLRRFHILGAGFAELTYWQDVTSIDKPLVINGFVTVTTHLEMLSLVERVFSITPN